MKTNSDQRDPVCYKLLVRESLDDGVRYQCALCLEIRNMGDLVFHASMRHGTLKFMVDAWPPEVNGE